MARRASYKIVRQNRHFYISEYRWAKLSKSMRKDLLEFAPKDFWVRRYVVDIENDIRSAPLTHEQKYKGIRLLGRMLLQIAHGRGG